MPWRVYDFFTVFAHSDQRLRHEYTELQIRAPESQPQTGHVQLRRIAAGPTAMADRSRPSLEREIRAKGMDPCLAKDSR